MKKFISMIVLVLMMFPVTCFAVEDWKYVCQNNSNDEYYIDRTSAVTIKWDSAKDDFQFSVLCRENFSTFTAARNSVRGIPTAYVLARLVFRRHKDKTYYKILGEVGCAADGTVLKSNPRDENPFSSWHKIKSGSVYEAIYDSAYDEL